MWFFTIAHKYFSDYWGKASKVIKKSECSNLLYFGSPTFVLLMLANGIIWGKKTKSSVYIFGGAWWKF